MHGTVNNYFEYPITLFSRKYKAYWVAYFNTNPVPNGTNLNQMFSVFMNNTETIVSTKPQTVYFTETYLGEYTAPVFGVALLRAKCATGAANQISLDYIKLIPILP
jgi:hypothetical protein